MLNGVRLGLAVAVPLVLAGCATSGGDQMSNTVYATHRIVKNLEQTMGSTVSELNATAAQLSQRVDQTEQTSLRLQAMVEENQVKLDRLQSDLSRLTDTIYRQFGLSTGPAIPQNPSGPVYVPSEQVVTTPPDPMSSTAPVDPAPLTMEGDMPMTTPPPSGVTTPAPAADSNPMELYTQASQLLQDRNYNDALNAFDSFITQYPASSYTSNAMYWKGQCLLKLEQDQAAIGEFQKLIDQYPSSDRVPSAYYYQGLAYGRLGQQQLAVDKLRHVVANYPSSDAASSASQALERLRQ